MKAIFKSRFILCLCIINILVSTSNAQEPFWAKPVSSPDYEYGIDSDLDSQGNIFVVGYGTGPVLEINNLSYNTNGRSDAFIAKFSNTHQLIWFRTLGGNDALYYDSGLDIHVDDNDDVIILLKSTGSNFTYNGQILPGINSAGSTGGEGVIIKVDNDGNYLWHDHGSVRSSFQNVATDASGNIYLTGWFNGTITLGDSITMTNTTNGTTQDMFVAKYFSNGHLVWAKHVGGIVSNSTAYGNNIAFDRPSERVVIVGKYYKDVYFDTGVLSTTLLSSGFLVSYDNDGTELWVKSIFNNGFSSCQGLAISSNSLIGVAGSNSLADGPDGLVGFYDLNGNIQSEAIYYSNECNLFSLEFNQSDECFITGTFEDSVALGIAPDTILLVNASTGFVLKLDSNLIPVWARQLPASFGNKVTCKYNRILYSGRIDDPFTYNFGMQTIVNNSGDAIFCEFTEQPCIVSDVNTSATDTSLTADNIFATYQWLDCNTNYAVIAGETDQTFFPTANGSYAVQLTQNNCIDTSHCVDITHIGIIENDFGNKFSLYPNPTSGQVTIDLGKNFQNILVTLTDMNGRIIQSKMYEGKQMTQLKIEATPGVYLLKVEAGEKKAMVRVVKK